MAEGDCEPPSPSEPEPSRRHYLASFVVVSRRTVTHRRHPSTWNHRSSCGPATFAGMREDLYKDLRVIERLVLRVNNPIVEPEDLSAEIASYAPPPRRRSLAPAAPASHTRRAWTASSNAS